MSDETLVTPDEALTPGTGPTGPTGLADVVLELAHHLDVRSPELRGLVPLTGTEVAVMREIHRRPHATPSAIASTTGLARSNVSTALRTLEAGGLVVREHPAGDGRRVELVPTALAAEHMAQIHAFWAERLGRAPEPVLAAALDALPVLTELAAALAHPDNPLTST